MEGNSNEFTLVMIMELYREKESSKILPSPPKYWTTLTFANANHTNINSPISIVANSS